MWFTIGAILVVLATFVLPAFYIVPQWEKAAIVRFGSIEKIMGTGLHFRVPLIDTIMRVDIRTQTIDLMGQQAITRDNISVIIDAVVFMRIEDPERLILGIQDYRVAVSKYAQTAIRNIIGTYNLDDLLESREEVAGRLKEEIDLLVKDWGIDITRAGLQDISLPVDMKRAFAVQAEAELEASHKLREAALNMGDPNAMQLRVLSTLNDISKDQSNTLILALPLETMGSIGIQGVASLAAIKKKEKSKTRG